MAFMCNVAAPFLAAREVNLIMGFRRQQDTAQWWRHPNQTLDLARLGGPTALWQHIAPKQSAEHSPSRRVHSLIKRGLIL